MFLIVHSTATTIVGYNKKNSSQMFPKIQNQTKLNKCYVVDERRTFKFGSHNSIYARISYWLLIKL